MKFIADQDVYQATVKFIKNLDFDIICAREVGLSSAADENILEWAFTNDRILVTRDKDFGALIFLKRQNNPGVIFLRIEPAHIRVKRFPAFMGGNCAIIYL